MRLVVAAIAALLVAPSAAHAALEVTVTPGTTIAEDSRIRIKASAPTNDNDRLTGRFRLAQGKPCAATAYEDRQAVPEHGQGGKELFPYAPEDYADPAVPGEWLVCVWFGEFGKTKESRSIPITVRGSVDTVRLVAPARVEATRPFTFRVSGRTDTNRQLKVWALRAGQGSCTAVGRRWADQVLELAYGEHEGGPFSARRTRKIGLGKPGRWTLCAATAEADDSVTAVAARTIVVRPRKRR